MPNQLRQKLQYVSNRDLYISLMITQLIFLIIGTVLYYFFVRPELSLADIFHFNNIKIALIVGFTFFMFVLMIDIILYRFVPAKYFDDGGVNQRLFEGMPTIFIIITALCVSFIEEWVFRGVLQNWIGLYWTSLLFALLHIRYLYTIGYFIAIVAFSFGFGFIYEWTNSIWSVITAHFFVNATLGLLIRHKVLQDKSSTTY